MKEDKDAANQRGKKSIDGPESRSGRGETITGESPEEQKLFSELGFSAFILSLSTSALVHVGELPDPITNQRRMALPLARQTISIIEMLKEKTKGNLTQEEEKLLDNVLYDLRLKYVKASESSPKKKG